MHRVNCSLWFSDLNLRGGKSRKTCGRYELFRRYFSMKILTREYRHYCDLSKNHLQSDPKIFDSIQNRLCTWSVDKSAASFATQKSIIFLFIFLQKRESTSRLRKIITQDCRCFSVARAARSTRLRVDDSSRFIVKREFDEFQVGLLMCTRILARTRCFRNFFIESFGVWVGKFQQFLWIDLRWWSHGILYIVDLFLTWR